MTIYTITTENSIKFGHDPMYSLEDVSNESEMVWATPAEYDLPDGYTIGKLIDDTPAIFAPDGRHCEIAHHCGGPCLVTSKNITPLEVISND